MNRKKLHVRALATAAILAIGAATSASAQISGINFAATTKFCFTSGCTNYTASATMAGVALTGGSFNGSTNGGGALGITGVNLDNFGIIAFDATVGNPNPNTYTFNNTPFEMQVIFSAPTGPVPATQTWNGFINGSFTDGVVTSTTLDVTFSGVQVSPETYFNTATLTTGLFDESVGGASISNGLHVDNTTHGFAGNITVEQQTVQSSTPEPASLVLLGTGLLGVVGVARRRNRRA